METGGKMNPTKEVIGYRHSARYGVWEEITRQRAYQIEKTFPPLQKHAFQAKEPTTPSLRLRKWNPNPKVPQSWKNAWRTNPHTQKLFRTPFQLRTYAKAHRFTPEQTNQINQHYINTICGRPQT
ncbi:MAG TPA: hypothetical protein VMW25_02240 [Clostridia bacterium]|nr:hypothetical protein [Clostridia bacterium]